VSPDAGAGGSPRARRPAAIYMAAHLQSCSMRMSKVTSAGASAASGPVPRARSPRAHQLERAESHALAVAALAGQLSCASYVESQRVDQPRIQRDERETAIGPGADHTNQIF
jgi:hypothetical protein